MSFRNQSIVGWLQNPIDNLFHKCLIRKRYRRNRSHTPRIWSLVVVKYALIVLRRCQYLPVISIAHTKNTQFNAFQKLLNYNHFTRLAKLAAIRHFF